MSKQGETKFKERAMADLKEMGAYVLKTQEMSRKGVPDLLVCLNGKFIAIELKDEGEKPTPLQANRLQCIRNAGGYAFGTMPSQWDAHVKLLKEIAK